jgi:hypothetical protein
MTRAPLRRGRGGGKEGPSDGGSGAWVVGLLLAAGGVFLCAHAFAVEPDALVEGLAPPEPASDVRAFDTRNDEGGSITVEWSPSPEEAKGHVITYEILRSSSLDPEPVPVGNVAMGTTSFRDGSAEDGIDYVYTVRVRDGLISDSEPTEAVRSSGQFLHRGRVNVLIAVLLYGAFVVFFIAQARGGKELYVRRIAGLEAVEEALGRATEMGKPVLFVPGLSTIQDVATIAALNILSRLAKKAAEYETRIIIPNRNPIVMPVCQEIVREACVDAGRPDAFREDDIYYVTFSQFGYVAAVDGIMLREKPATNFFLGMFWAESLILAETGASIGAIQIAGTDAVTQLPFFIAACDYTLIGEELYAASAYLSREPLQLGSLKGQDLAKVLIAACIIAGIVLTSLGMPFFASLFSAG